MRVPTTATATATEQARLPKVAAHIPNTHLASAPAAIVQQAAEASTLIHTTPALVTPVQTVTIARSHPTTTTASFATVQLAFDASADAPAVSHPTITTLPTVAP